MEIPQEFVDIFFTLVSYIISLQGSTNTLAMQVTVNLLISALENKRLDRYKVNYFNKYKYKNTYINIKFLD